VTDLAASGGRIVVFFSRKLTIIALEVMPGPAGAALSF
jgi:hypothetical protein